MELRTNYIFDKKQQGIMNKQIFNYSNVYFSKELEKKQDIFSEFNQIVSGDSISTDKNKKNQSNNKKIKFFLYSALTLLLLNKVAKHYLRKNTDLNCTFAQIRNIIGDIPPSSPPPNIPPNNILPPQNNTPPCPNKIPPIIGAKNNPLFRLAMAIKLTAKGKQVPEIVLPEEEFKKLLDFLKRNNFNQLDKDVRDSLLFYINKLPMKLKKMLPEYVFKLLPKGRL